MIAARTICRFTAEMNRAAGSHSRVAEEGQADREVRCHRPTEVAQVTEGICGELRGRP